MSRENYANFINDAGLEFRLIIYLKMIKTQTIQCENVIFGQNRIVRYVTG